MQRFYKHEIGDFFIVTRPFSSTVEILFSIDTNTFFMFIEMLYFSLSC